MSALLWAARGQKAIGPYLLTIGVLILAVVVLGIVVVLLRRRLLAKDAAADHGGLLDGLRGMRDRGEISVEEYDAARRRMVAKLSGQPVAPGPSAPVRGRAQAPSSSGASPGVSAVRGGDARVARPGFDLTGAPLPKPGKEPPPVR